MPTRRNNIAKVGRDTVKPKTQALAQRSPGEWRRVAEALQTEIIFGRLYPRERLTEDELMSRFGSSRHAARAAIDELVLQGLVLRETNRGASVRAFNAKEVEELFEVQQILEAHAIRRMPLPVPREVIDRLKEIQVAHERAGADMQALEICHWNREFHHTLFSACGNAQLAETIRGYGLLTDPIRMRRIPDPAWRKQAVADHRLMIRLLAAQDREGLIRACARHLDPTRDHYLALQANAVSVR